MNPYARRAATLVTTAMLASSGLAAIPAPAHAETYDELQQRVEECSAAYDEAMANIEQIQDEIDENEEKIAQIESEMPEQRKRASDSLKTLYKMQQSSKGLIDLVLSSDDFSQMIATVTYLSRIQSKNMNELLALGTMNAELSEAKDTLTARHAQANQEAERALEAKEEALAAREEVRQQAIAQAQAEQAAAQAAIEAAAKAAEEGKTFTNASGQETPVQVAPSPSPDPEPIAPTPTPAPEEEKKEENSSPQNPEPASDREAFVNTWAPRIDAYLAGYPLGGHGRTFAEAAWDYNVDPRWSPAISCIESTKGTYCFRSHNAWGWGSVDWPDWDTAIRSHVAGLSRGYGYTISPSNAQKYCPPTWQEWYSSVLSEMESI